MEGRAFIIFLLYNCLKTAPATKIQGTHVNRLRGASFGSSSTGFINVERFLGTLNQDATASITAGNFALVDVQCSFKQDSSANLVTNMNQMFQCLAGASISMRDSSVIDITGCQSCANQTQFLVDVSANVSLAENAKISISSLGSSSYYVLYFHIYNVLMMEADSQIVFNSYNGGTFAIGGLYVNANALLMVSGNVNIKTDLTTNIILDESAELLLAGYQFNTGRNSTIHLGNSACLESRTQVSITLGQFSSLSLDEETVLILYSNANFIIGQSAQLFIMPEGMLICASNSQLTTGQGSRLTILSDTILSLDYGSQLNINPGFICQLSMSVIVPQNANWIIGGIGTTQYSGFSCASASDASISQ